MPNAVTGLAFVLSGLASSTTYNVQVLAVNAAGPGTASAVLTANTTGSALVTSITWNLAPVGPYTHGSGQVGVNAHITPPSATVQFGFSNSTTVPPSSWVPASFVNTDLWASYVPVPATAGTWFAWAEGTDGSSPRSIRPLLR